mgnify:CR=1 FL=1
MRLRRMHWLQQNMHFPIGKFSCAEGTRAGGVKNLEDRIRQLETECPTEWTPLKKEIDNAHVDMRGKYEETMHAIGKAAPVSVPG